MLAIETDRFRVLVAPATIPVGFVQVTVPVAGVHVQPMFVPVTVMLVGNESTMVIGPTASDAPRLVT